MKPRFIVDLNVGKLAKRLRMMGYDALFIDGVDDGELVRTALKEGRVLLTKDTGIMRRRIVSSGRVRAILITSDDIKQQLEQVVQTLHLDPEADRFSICMECNQPLIPIAKEDVRDVIPPYVFETQEQYVRCPSCRRVYWQGTHWQKMVQELEGLKG